MSLDSLPSRLFEAKLGLLDSLPLLPSPWCDYAREYIIAGAGEGKSAKTAKIYTYVLARFLNFLNDTGPPVNAALVRRYIFEQQVRGLTPSTVHIHYRTLHSWFNWLVKEKTLPHSPMENIKPPKLAEVVIPAFTTEELKRILAICSGKRFVDLRNRAMILLLLDTGIRLAETARLEYFDVEPGQQLIKVHGKGGKERIVPFGRKTLAAIQVYVAKRHDEYEALWVSEERRPMTYYGVATAIRRVVQFAEVTRVKRGPHTFRHTMAITYLRNGGDVFTLQKILGHKTLEMTQRYAKVLIDDVVKAHRKASPVDNLRL